MSNKRPNEELRRAQAETETGRARYFDFYDLAPVGYCTLSEKGLILEANLTAASLLGVTRDALVKKPLSRFIVNEDQDICHFHCKKLFEAHSTGSGQAVEPREWELRLVKPDGTLIWGHLTATAAEAEDGAPVCRVVISDITGRKQAEEELRTSRELSERIIEDGPVAITLVDRDGKIVFANTHAERLLCLDRSSIEALEYNSPDWQITDVDGSPFPIERLPFHQVMSTGQAVYDVQHAIHTPDAARKILSINGAPLHDEQGRINRVVFAIQDITGRKEAEEALKERVKELALLQSISQIIQKTDSFEGFCQKTVCAIPNGFYYPEITCARIMCEGQSYQTENFSETEWCLSADLKVEDKSVGAVEVFYLEERPARDEGPFIKEERNLIDLCAERLGRVTERMQAEEAQRESLQRLEFALRGGELGTWDWNPQDGAVVYSDLWAQMLEYRPDEVEPTVEFFKQHVHPEDLAAVLERLTGHVEGRLPVYESEHRVRTKSGRWLWVLDRGKIAERDKDGRPVRVTGLIADITERKQAEEDLRRFRIISDNSVYGKAIADLKGNLLYINRFFANIHGYEPGEMFGKHLSVFHSREQMEAVERLNATIVREGQYAPTTVWHRHKDGTDFPMLMTGVLIKDDYGNPQCIATSAIDMTAQHQAEAKLAESEKLLSRSQEISHTGSWKLDLAANHLTWSDEVYRIFGCEPQEFAATYEAFLDFVHPDDRAEVDEAYSRSVQEGSAGYEIEHRIVRRNSGEVRHIHERCVHERDAAGTIIQSTGMVQDITERKRAERRLQESKSRLSAILYSMGVARTLRSELQ